MDGIISKESVLMLASTNRADVLDKVSENCTYKYMLQVQEKKFNYFFVGFIKTWTIR